MLTLRIAECPCVAQVQDLAFCEPGDFSTCEEDTHTVTCTGEGGIACDLTDDGACTQLRRAPKRTDIGRVDDLFFPRSAGSVTACGGANALFDQWFAQKLHSQASGVGRAGGTL